ncbi:carbohydrate ABC transporter permease [Paenibacillus thermotolerans]|uniref:carbohydrate ABC transporter permease n=1 Tax=Paenibacillus thermotolerans TaxID=3027807 RepID=UPI00236743A0|nr:MULTISPECIES: carbohydrate ABC transporter permease [unclassified Paenibacillus]
MTTASAPVKSKYYQNRRTREKIVKAVVTCVLVVGSLSFLAPFWWMVQTSLKTLQEIVTYPPTWFPKEIVWSNYPEAWKQGRFGQYTINTLFLSTVAVIAQVVSNSFIAYGFAKIRFPGKSLLFSIILGTMIIPGFVTLIPQYVLFSKLHWVGTYLPLTIPGFFGSAFMIFLFRQFFMTIPTDLIEAAKIDGANHLMVWARIMLPLAAPALATVAIMSFNGAWNDFLGPLIYVNDESKYTLQIGLQAFKVSSGVNQWHHLMAGSVMVMLPVIALFFFFQRYFIEGMNITAGTKG